MRKISIFTLIFILLASLLTCTSKNIIKENASYVPFNLLDRYPPVINKPNFAWKYEWKEGKHSSDDYFFNIDPIIVDEFGNVYFYSPDKILYSLSPDGTLRWKKNNTKIKNMLPVKGGILVNTKSRFYFYDTDGNMKWNKKGNFIDVGPNGMIYCFSKESLFDEIYYLFSCDSTGKIRWKYNFKYLNLGAYDGYFLDDKSNFYLLKWEYPSSYNLFSFSPEGKVLWEIHTNGMIENSFIKNKIIINDVFLISFKTTPLTINRENILENTRNQNIIVAISKKGKKLWSYIEPYDGDFIRSYVYGSNSNFYFVYYKDQTMKCYLQALSNTGKMIWERELNTRWTLKPIIDKENNIYIGIDGFSKPEPAPKGTWRSPYPWEERNVEMPKYETDRTIYCYSPDGNLKWSMKQPYPKEDFDMKTVLFIGQNKTIYYMTNENKIFAIQDSE